MTSLSLVTSFTATREIADEAISTLGAARQTLLELEALLRTIASTADQRSDVAQLAKLGAYAAMDQGNGYDCSREEYSSRLDKCAPQILKTEIVARESEVSGHES